MKTVQAYPNGMICWPELETNDQPGAKSFYQALFGWTLQTKTSASGAAYDVAKIADASVAGLSRLCPDLIAEGARPRWSLYAAVSSIEQTLARAAANGGEIRVAAFEVPGVARMALLRDPVGTELSLWQATGEIGATAANVPGTGCWYELHTDRSDIAQKFYGEVLGWSFSPSNAPGSRSTFIGLEGRHFGIVEDRPDLRGTAAYWLPYFLVGQCDESVSRALALGAKLLSPATDIPNVGRFAVIEDPQGARLALFEYRA